MASLTVPTDGVPPAVGPGSSKPSRRHRIALDHWAEHLPPPHPEARWTKYAARFGGVLSFITLIAYLLWRAFATIPDSGWDRTAGWILLGCEMIPVLPILFRLIALWTIDPLMPPRRLDSYDDPYLPVVVFIPTFNEPRDVLTPTVAAALDLDPAHETWVLDDGNREWVRDMCEYLGARYVTRSEHTQAKAGNINHALGLLRAEGNPAEIVAVLDCDHVPLPGFLAETLGWFDREDIAIVQAPQSYYNSGAFDDDGAAGDQGLFFHVQMVARNGEKSDPTWCGSTSLLRIKALEEIGGVATETLIEDTHSTLKLVKAGWHTVYHHQVLAIGLAPDTPRQFLVQRSRWAIGHQQMFVVEKLWWPKKWLSWRNYTEYVSSIFWWLEGPFTVALFMVPLALLVSGTEPFTVDPMVYAIVFPSAMAVQLWGVKLLYRSYINYRAALEFRVMRIPVGLAALRWLFTRHRTTFNVTPKGAADERLHDSVPRSLWLILAVNTAGLVYAIATLAIDLPWHSSVPATVAGCIWLGWGEVVMLMGINRIRSNSYVSSLRYAHRFDVEAEVRVQGVRGELVDISLGGLAVRFDGEAPPDDQPWVVIAGADRMTMQLVRRHGGIASYKVRFGDWDAYRAIALWLFHTPSHDGHSIPEGIPAAAIRPRKERITFDRTRRGDIQGLRAIAVLLVVASHLGLSGFSGGFIGVDIFFAISGFIITSQMLREHAATGRISLLNFYVRRALRILPAALVVTVAILVVSGLTQASTRVHQHYLDALWSSFFVENVHLIRVATDYFADQAASPFQHFWSLSVEEQFYLVWPVLAIGLLALKLRKPYLVWIVWSLATISLGWSVYQTANNPNSAYFSTFVRAHELGIGVVLAILLFKIAATPKWFMVAGSWVGGALIVASLVFVDETGFPSWEALIPVSGAALLIAAGQNRHGGLPRLLGKKPIAWFGDISYSLYLWHWPIILFARDLVPESWNTALVNIALFGLSVLAAWLSYNHVEQPLLAMRRGMLKGWRPMLFWPVAIATTFAVAFSANGYAQWRYDHELQKIAHWYTDNATMCDQLQPDDTMLSGVREVNLALRCAHLEGDEGAPMPSTLTPEEVKADDWTQGVCWQDTGYANKQACSNSDADAPYTVVLLGDSHMGHWMPALEGIAAERDLHLVPYVLPGCTPFDVPSEQGGIDSKAPACEDFRTKARAAIADLHPDLILVAGLVDYRIADPKDDEGQMWREAIATAAKAFAGFDADVVVLGDIPTRETATDECIAAHPDSLAKCATTPGATFTTTYQYLKSTFTGAGVAYVDILPLICDGYYCPAVVDEKPVYFDTNHLTLSWSEYAAPALNDVLSPYLDPLTEQMS